LEGWVLALVLEVLSLVRLMDMEDLVGAIRLLKDTLRN